MTKNLELQLSAIYSLFFCAYFFLRTDLHLAQTICLLLLIITFLIFFISLKKKIELKKLFKIKKTDYSILALLIFLCVIYSINPDANLNDHLGKKFCRSSFFSENLAVVNFKIFLCKHIISLLLIFSILFYFFTKNIYKFINIEKIFIYTAIFFIFISLINLIIYFVLNELYYLRIIIEQAKENHEFLQIFYNGFLKYYNGNQYAYFQFLPITSSGFRNIEVFSIYPGYIASLYLVIKNYSYNKKLSNPLNAICILIFICLFLSFSRALWISIFFVNLFIFIFLYFDDKKKFLNFILFQIKKIFILTLTIILLNIFFQSNIFKSNYMTNLNYYTLSKISTLILNSRLTDYFNYKNTQGWFYWNEYNNFNKEIDVNIKNLNENERKKFFDEKVSIYMNEHLNSNPTRKQIYSQAIDLILKKPLFGYGVSNFEFKLNNLNGNTISRGNAESQFLQIILEKGFVVFFLFLFLFYKAFNKVNIISYGNLVLVGVISFSLFVTLQMYFFYWILLSLCLASNNIEFKK